MMLWMTLLAMATLEVAVMVRTLVVIATTLATIAMVIITLLLVEDLTSALALQQLANYLLTCLLDELSLSD
jgi:hypothetical protein